jgi:transcriptional regulator with XRE-family HTH domain
MAERLGVAQSVVSRWRTGDQIPDDNRAHELGRILGYSEAEILESITLLRAARQADRVERIQAARRAAIEQEIRRSRSRR